MSWMSAQKKGQDEAAAAGKPAVAKVSKKASVPSTKARKAEGKPKATQKSPVTRLKQYWEEFRQYLREVVYELKKVVWPSRKETLGTTSVVLVLVILCAVFLGMVDSLLSRLIEMVFG